MTTQIQERGQSPANLTKSKFSECMQVWYIKRLGVPFSPKLFLEISNFQNFQTFDFLDFLDFFFN